jgi:valyl-tRNA synthetase
MSIFQEASLGDTAVAVNPHDERYKNYIGQIFVVDVGAARPLQLKIIADEQVDPAFGTGALGVTPAHSAVDFEMYEKQKASGNPIELIQVIGTDGKMTDAAGKNYEGCTIEEAREKFVEYLRGHNLLEKEEDIIQNVGTSDRFNDVVEAVPLTQWFVDVNKKIPGKEKSLKDLMREAVTLGHHGDPNKKVNITPERFEKIYLHWIDNLRDWCISRQIWWGHRIPVWYCASCNKEVVSLKTKGEWYFMRHGETDWNKERKVQGHQDIPLNERGKEQAYSMANYFEKIKIDLVISSDLQRAAETARIIADQIGVEHIEDQSLREKNFGIYEGQPIEDIITAHLKDGNPYEFVPEKGESWKQVDDRIHKILEHHKKQNGSKNILIVTHSGVMRVFLRRLQKTDGSLFYSHGKRVQNSELLHYSIAEPCEKCDCDFFVQDADTLDTWFSSGLWTFSTLGWPNETEDLKNFHPTNWMQMGTELLFFWMARMILFSTYVLDEIPFENAYIHGILRDEHGKKFSKSAGNGIDPIVMIDQYGADALRWGVLSGIAPGNDSRFYTEKIEGARNLVNKLWNIARFMLQNSDVLEIDIQKPQLKTEMDQWIMWHLDGLVFNIHEDFYTYDFSYAGERLRDFTWNELADWYLEAAKVEGEKKEILNYILTIHFAPNFFCHKRNKRVPKF